MGVPSHPTANPCDGVTLRAAVWWRASGPGAVLLLRAALVVLSRELIDRGVLHDVLARDLPCLLHDPRERAVLPRRLLLDLLQHVLGEIEALLALVGTGHGAFRLPGVVSVSRETNLPARTSECQASVNGPAASGPPFSRRGRPVIKYRAHL